MITAHIALKDQEGDYNYATRKFNKLYTVKMIHNIFKHQYGRVYSNSIVTTADGNHYAKWNFKNATVMLRGDVKTVMGYRTKK